MKKLNLITKIGIPAATFAILLTAVWFMGGTAKAEVKTLQQSVEMAQVDYDFSQTATKAAMIQACHSWKELAIAKAQLADAMKISSSLDENALKTKNCEDAASLVPASF